MADIYTVAQAYDNSGNEITAARVGANNHKAAAASNFSTRTLSFYKATLSGVETGYTAANSDFVKIIYGLQRVAQLAFVGTPASNNFVFAVETDTNNGAGVGNTSNDSTLADAATASLGSSVTVTALTASGASIA